MELNKSGDDVEKDDAADYEQRGVHFVHGEAVTDACTAVMPDEDDGLFVGVGKEGT